MAATVLRYHAYLLRCSVGPSRARYERARDQHARVVSLYLGV
jgi:hypothetical protein